MCSGCSTARQIRTATPTPMVSRRPGDRHRPDPDAIAVEATGRRRALPADASDRHGGLGDERCPGWFPRSAKATTRPRPEASSTMIVVVPLLAVSMSTTTPVAVTSLASVASPSAASSTDCRCGKRSRKPTASSGSPVFETQLERAIPSTDAPFDDDVGAAGDHEVPCGHHRGGQGCRPCHPGSRTCGHRRSVQARPSRCHARERATPPRRCARRRCRRRPCLATRSETGTLTEPGVGR